MLMLGLARGRWAVSQEQTLDFLARKKVEGKR